MYKWVFSLSSSLACLLALFRCLSLFHSGEHPLSGEGYWGEAAPASGVAVCAAADPAADFRWHALTCGGPEVASFICELPGTDTFINKY